MGQESQETFTCQDCGATFSVSSPSFQGAIRLTCICNRGSGRIIGNFLGAQTDSLQGTRGPGGHGSLPSPRATQSREVANKVSPKAAAPRIGNYQLIKLVGKGAMGEIYLGQHIQEKSRKVAIKLLTQKLQTENIAAQRFRQETEIHSRLQHPNIVRVMEIGCYNAQLYFVMEYIEGKSLEQHLETRGKIIPEYALKICVVVAQALEYALEQKIIHRDLKPANIMMEQRSKRIKLTDFGLGKIMEKEGITMTGQAMGTAYYMPPEQIQNAKLADHRADIYSLGATLYHMLCGKPPFGEKKTTLSILREKSVRDPYPLQELHPAIPMPVVKIVEKAMQRDANKRYSSPTEMIREMKRVLQII